MIPSYLDNRGWNSEKLWCTCVAVTCRAIVLEMRVKLVSLPVGVLLNFHIQFQQAYEFKKDREGRQWTYEHWKQITASTLENFACANVNYFYDDFASLEAICSKVCTSHLSPDCLGAFQATWWAKRNTLGDHRDSIPGTKRCRQHSPPAWHIWGNDKDTRVEQITCLQPSMLPSSNPPAKPSS